MSHQSPSYLQSIYVVAFNLQSRRRNYEKFFAELQAKQDWFNFFDNAWLVDTDETAQQLGERLNLYLGQDDYILVMRVTPDYFGLLPPEAWEWLEAKQKTGSLK